MIYIFKRRSLGNYTYTTIPKYVSHIIEVTTHLANWMMPTANPK